MDAFLELSCFFEDPTDAGNLISASSAFSKPSLNIWKFLIHVLLKPSLENFQHYFASLWDECNWAVVWMFLWRCLSLGLQWKLTYSSLWSLLSFPNLLAYWVQHIKGIIFRNWNSSAEIPSPPLALFIVMLPKAHWNSHYMMSGSRWVITPSWLSGSLRSFLHSSSVYSWHLILISSHSFCPLLCSSLHEMFPWCL